ncbi:MAG: hypothetical protein KIT27_07690 [Legionellales bacterium]|nr:hypothetical protein [Legionellales bacterium]
MEFASITKSRQLADKINAQLKSTIRIVTTDGAHQTTQELMNVTRSDLSNLPQNCAIKFSHEGLEIATHHDSTRLISANSSTFNISLSLALEYLSLQLTTIMAKLDQAKSINITTLSEAIAELKAQYLALGLSPQQHDYVLHHIPERIAQLEDLLNDLSAYNAMQNPELN